MPGASGCVTWLLPDGRPRLHAVPEWADTVAHAARSLFYLRPETRPTIADGLEQEYNTLGPHGSLDYRPRAPDTIMPGLQLAASPR